MAYYGSSYYGADPSEYHQTPYYCSSDFILSHVPQPLAAQSTSYDYGYGAYNFSGHDQTPGYGASESDLFMGRTTVAYSMSTFSEPNKYFAYDPALYSGNYSASQTQFSVSYSVSEFNEPEFEEYDPTPYGGGYDLAQTYGKPLPPSSEICYPHSSMDPNAIPLSDFSHESIEPPYGKHESEAQTQDTSNLTESTEDNRGEESQGNYPDDVHPSWSGPGSGDGNGTVGDQGVEYEKRLPQIPSGYGLEAMDLCESIFGYWPCLSQAKRHHDRQAVSGEGGNDDQWKGAADYLFGGSDPYGEKWEIGGSYQNPMYAYERHYQEQSLYRQIEYE